jgi:hypothetical protein
MQQPLGSMTQAGTMHGRLIALFTGAWKQGVFPQAQERSAICILRRRGLQMESMRRPGNPVYRKWAWAGFSAERIDFRRVRDAV